ncbi:MAG: putative photosynthetic complex assembly protein PuhE [Pseudomonadota bacterium]
MLLTVLVALFVWWFSTGAIFWAVSRGAGRAEVLLSAPTAAVSAYGLVWAADFGTPTGALMGFGCAIVVWGWFELAFLTGVITGPNKRVCPPGLNGHRHFLMAWGTLAHHELALLGTAIGLGAAVWHAPDHTGLWTFLILFAARISAKLNVYLGVPNLSHDLMPDAVAHMKTYFANKRMNWLFPISVTVMSGALAFWAGHAAAIPGDPTGYTLLAALTGLALIEHWLMVLPVRDQALWQWMTKSRTNAGPAGAKPADDG